MSQSQHTRLRPSGSSHLENTRSVRDTRREEKTVHTPQMCKENTEKHLRLHAYAYPPTLPLILSCRYPFLSASNTYVFDGALLLAVRKLPICKFPELKLPMELPTRIHPVRKCPIRVLPKELPIRILPIRLLPAYMLLVVLPIRIVLLRPLTDREELKKRSISAFTAETWTSRDFRRFSGRLPTL